MRLAGYKWGSFQFVARRVMNAVVRIDDIDSNFANTDNLDDVNRIGTPRAAEAIDVNDPDG